MRRLLKTTLGIFFLLACCTVAAVRVDFLLLPSVCVETAGKARIGEKLYEVCVPRECVYQDEQGRNYVMVILQREGVWRTENYVRKESVEILDQDYWNAALEESGEDTRRFAAYASRGLRDDETVQLIE